MNKYVKKRGIVRFHYKGSEIVIKCVMIITLKPVSSNYQLIMYHIMYFCIIKLYSIIQFEYFAFHMVSFKIALVFNFTFLYEKLNFLFKKKR